MNFQKFIQDTGARLLRNFPYPYKEKIFGFPPLETSQSKDAVHLAIGAQEKTLIEALWSAWTWVYHLKISPSLTFYLDNPVSEKHRIIVGRVFPAANIVSMRDAIDPDLLLHPICTDIANQYRFGRVLLLKLSLQRTRKVLFSDPDVLVFYEPNEIQEGVSEGYNVHMIEPNAWIEPDPWISHRAADLGLEVDKRFNCGVMVLHPGSLSFRTFFKLIEGWTMQNCHFFMEQAVFAALSSEAASREADPEKYVVSGIGAKFWKSDIDYSGVVVRHYVGNVRHRLYTSGYPRVISQVLR